MGCGFDGAASVRVFLSPFVWPCSRLCVSSWGTVVLRLPSCAVVGASLVGN